MRPWSAAFPRPLDEADRSETFGGARLPNGRDPKPAPKSHQDALHRIRPKSSPSRGTRTSQRIK